MAKTTRFSGTAFDDLLMFRDADDEDMEGDEWSDALDLRQTPADGMTVKVVVPECGAGDELIVEVQASDDDATYETIAQSETIDAVGEYSIRFATQRRYVRSASTTNSSGSNCFGPVQIGVVTHGF
ncbi:MAG TPA: hypothetical protein VMW50_06915 [Dehalococcoidia bacterium]|nr:hypothetical protein [Dehalococcoidia bacterium]